MFFIFDSDIHRPIPIVLLAVVRLAMPDQVHWPTSRTDSTVRPIPFYSDFVDSGVRLNSVRVITIKLMVDFVHVVVERKRNFCHTLTTRSA